MWIEYNPNPTGKRVGDCVIRAISKALDVDWDTAFAIVVSKAFAMKDMPSSDSVWAATLRLHGFCKRVLPDTCPECYTAKDFCEDNPQGVFVLAFNEHAATVIDGNLYDSWNSEDEPITYFWYRKDD